jgi:hypothetical protein
MIARLSIIARLVAEHARYRMALEAIATDVAVNVTTTHDRARAQTAIARTALDPDWRSR